MSEPTLRVPPKVRELIRRSHPDLKRKIRFALAEILDDPSVDKQLQRELKGYQSLPVGRYRIIYRAVDLGIDVIALGPRSTIYREIVPETDPRHK
jgi:mRNA-degrading endonuclease RelE of RelBE toxin-antitoxin system